jgi:hypothetical protein
MNQQARIVTLRKILAFAASIEIGTGLVLIIDPAIVVKLLLGLEVSSEGTVIGRCFGTAALALGLACWPGRHSAEGSWPTTCSLGFISSTWARSAT